MDAQFLSPGFPCRAFLYLPDGWRRPITLPTIVIVPGGKGMRSDAKDGDCGFGLVELAKSFARNGFAAFCYDGRGQGDSERERTGHDLAVEDLHVALGFLRSNCDVVDTIRIGLFGQSVGGMAAVLVAERDEGIRSLILWGTLPRYSLTKTEPEARLASVLRPTYEKTTKDKPFDEFIRDFTVIDPIDHIGNLHQPILLAGGSDDTMLFRTEEQMQLFNSAKKSSNVMLLEVKSEIHRMRHWSPSFGTLSKIFSAWFSETL